jgi:hypothetical protein
VDESYFCADTKGAGPVAYVRALEKKYELLVLVLPAAAQPRSFSGRIEEWCSVGTFMVEKPFGAQLKRTSVSIPGEFPVVWMLGKRKSRNKKHCRKPPEEYVRSKAAKNDTDGYAIWYDMAVDLVSALCLLFKTMLKGQADEHMKIIGEPRLHFQMTLVVALC